MRRVMEYTFPDDAVVGGRERSDSENSLPSKNGKKHF